MHFGHFANKGDEGDGLKSSAGENRRASSDWTKWWAAAKRVILQAHFDKSLSILFLSSIVTFQVYRGVGSVLRIDWSATLNLFARTTSACVCVICWVCEATEAIKKRVIKRLCWLVEISSHTTLIIQSFITFLTSLLVTSLPAQIPLLEGPKVTVSQRSEQKRHSQFFEKPASLKYIFICILFIATNA